MEFGVIPHKATAKSQIPPPSESDTSQTEAAALSC